MVNFNMDLQAHLPLGTGDKFASTKFPLPISFIYGDEDWVLEIEEDIADVIVDIN